jgi:hypothetical protein
MIMFLTMKYNVGNHHHHLIHSKDKTIDRVVTIIEEDTNQTGMKERITTTVEKREEIVVSVGPTIAKAPLVAEIDIGHRLPLVHSR